MWLIYDILAWPHPCKEKPSLVPRLQGGEKWPGNNCMCMRQLPQQNMGLRIYPYNSSNLAQCMSVNHVRVI